MKALNNRNMRSIRYVKHQDDSLELLKMLLLCELNEGARDRLARYLLDRFGDLYSVIHADEKELAGVAGLKPSTIDHLKQTRRLLKQIGLSSISDRPLIDSLDRVKQFCRLLLGSKRREEFHVLFLDEGYHLLGHECLQIGTLNHVMV